MIDLIINKRCVKRCAYPFERCFENTSVSQLLNNLNPKLKPHQKVVLIPTGFFGNEPDTREIQPEIGVSARADQYFNLAASDSRVIAVMPYMWEIPTAPGSFSPGYKGTGSSTILMDKFRWIGRTILGLGTQCWISQTSCAKNPYPSYEGRFPDDYFGSGSNHVACMRRAMEFHRWCDNPSTVTTTASFIENGLVAMASG